MALPTITPQDFIGWLKISINEFKESEIEEYISTFLGPYIQKIFGDAAFIDIKNQDRDKWEDLLNGAEFLDPYIDDKRRLHNSVVESLKAFIFFEYVRDNFSSTVPGKVKGEFSNSSRVPDIEVLNIAVSRYNRAVYRINLSTGDFLKYYEEIIEKITASADNLDNSYTLSIPSTKYLADGDTVEIANVEYTVSNLVENTSIDINATETGLDFTGELVLWRPYKDVEFCTLEPCGI